MADPNQFQVVPSPNYAAPMLNFGPLSGQKQSTQQQSGLPQTQADQQQNAAQTAAQQNAAQQNTIAQLGQRLRQLFAQQQQQQQPAGASTAISPMPQTFNPNQSSGLY